MSVTVTGSVRSHRRSPPQHGHWVIVTGTSTGGSLASEEDGALRKVNGPFPALRPGRFLRFAFRLDCPFVFPRPAAFNSWRSCSFSRRSRSISLCACPSRSRRSTTSASRSFNCSCRSSRWEPSIALYRGMRSPACPVFSFNVTGRGRFVQRLAANQLRLLELRRLHIELDLAIRDAYLWQNLPL